MSESGLRLDARGLRKTFRAPGGDVIDVLRGATFSAKAGELLAVRGASGAGKSTLLHLLGGLEGADEGTASLGNFDITSAQRDGLARWRSCEVGFVFQSHRLLLDLTAAENVALPLMIARANWREAYARARLLLESVGLTARAEHRASELSGGEQQRVAIARALVVRPKLLLADEPTGNLDERAGIEVSQLFISLARESHAVVLVATHNARLAALCDRVLSLRDGLLKETSESENTSLATEGNAAF